jgi:predicted nucleic acid-binding protein
MMLNEQAKGKSLKECLQNFCRAFIDERLRRSYGERCPFYAIDTNMIVKYLYPNKDEERISKTLKRLIERLFTSQRITVYDHILRETWYNIRKKEKSYYEAIRKLYELDRGNIRLVVGVQGRVEMPVSISEDLRSNGIMLSRADRNLVAYAIFERGKIVTYDWSINLLNFRHGLGPDLRCFQDIELECEGNWKI